MAPSDEKLETSFTTRDLVLFGHCMKCLKSEFAVDYEKLAEVAGYKNSNSSRVAFHRLKKKPDKLSTGPVQGNGPSLSVASDETPKSGKKRRTPAKAQDADAGADDNEEATPAKKKGRKPRATATPAKGKTGADVDDNEPEPEPEAAAVKSEVKEESEEA